MSQPVKDTPPAELRNALANSLRLVYQSEVKKGGPVVDYEKLSRRDLNKILMCNPPDVPHYQKAIEEQKRRNQFWRLIISCAALLLTVISSSSLGRDNPFALQVKQESWRRLNTRSQQFENYKNDFRQFGQSPHARRSRDAEDLTDVQLMVIADQVVVHLEYMETILEVYLKVGTKKDRLAIWPLVIDQVSTTRNRLDQQVEVINALIAGVRTPAVITEAMHMRDDLRGVGQDLDGAVKEIEAAEANLP